MYKYQTDATHQQYNPATTSKQPRIQK